MDVWPAQRKGSVREEPRASDRLLWQTQGLHDCSEGNHGYDSWTTMAKKRHIASIGGLLCQKPPPVEVSLAEALLSDRLGASQSGHRARAPPTSTAPSSAAVGSAPTSRSMRTMDVMRTTRCRDQSLGCPVFRQQLRGTCSAILWSLAMGSLAASRCMTPGT